MKKFAMMFTVGQRICIKQSLRRALLDVHKRREKVRDDLAAVQRFLGVSSDPAIAEAEEHLDFQIEMLDHEMEGFVKLIKLLSITDVNPMDWLRAAVEDHGHCSQ